MTLVRLNLNSLTVAALFTMIVAPLAIAADGRIEVRIVDEAGKLTPARVWVDSQDQRWYRPLSPEAATPYAKDRSLTCDGC